MQKLLNLGKTIIDKITLFVFIFVMAGTLTTNNLNGRVVGAIVVLALVVGLIYLIAFKAVGDKWSLPRPHRPQARHERWLFTAVTGIYQLFILYEIAGETGFDSGIVKWAAKSSSIEQGSYLYNYFSQYPNNLALMFSERWINHAMKFMGMVNFTIVLDVINLILIDIAIILIYRMLKEHFHRIFLWRLLPLVFLITPWVVVVYTDTAVLPFIAGMMFILQTMIHQLKKHTSTPLWSIFLGLLFGIVAVGAYLLKPTAIIIVIAIVIELVLNYRSISRQVNTKYLMLALVMAAVSFGTGYKINGALLSGQQFIAINTNITTTPSHFVMMGMNKATGGGYSQEDFLYSAKYSNRRDQNQANLKVIKHRLRNFGVVGYLKFLVQKNYHNTSDGTLGWLQEGDFFSKPSFKQHQFIKSFFYKWGSRVTIYQTIAQILWIGIIAGLILSFLDHSLFSRILRLSQLGLLLFLLFFEGGRARYMIQFLPITYVLAVIGWSKLGDIMRQRKLINFNWRNLRTILIKII